MAISGYKVFHGDMTNRYGLKFEEGQTYEVNLEENKKKGIRGYGYYYCTRLEECIIFYLDEDKKVAKVTGFENFRGDEENYEGICVARKIRIDKIMSREEIMDYIIGLEESRVVLFITHYKLTREEKNRISEFYSGSKAVKDALAWQKDDKIISLLPNIK